MKKSVFILLTTALCASSLAAIGGGVSFALFEKTKKIDDSNVLRAGSIQNNLIFLDRRIDSTSNVVWGVTGNEIEYTADTEYKIYMLAWNQGNVSANYLDNENDKAFKWIEGTSVSIENVTYSKSGGSGEYSLETKTISETDYTVSLLYFVFDTSKYDHLSFHRVAKDETPSVYTDRNRQDADGLSTNSSIELVKPTHKNNYNLYRLTGWQSAGNYGFLSSGEWSTSHYNWLLNS